MDNLESTVQEEAGFFGRMKDRVSDYASAAGQKAKTAAAIATVLAAGALGGKAQGATIDPTTLVNTNTSYDQAIADPHAGASGDIAGADFVSSIDSFVVLYDSGRVDFYQDSAGPIASTPYKSWGSIGSTGISAIDSSKYGAELALTDNGNVNFYDLDGNFKGGITTGVSDITDISYDQVNDRIIASRDNNTVTVAIDGTTDFLIGTGPDQAEYITLTEDGNGNPIDDLLQTGQAFYRIDDNTGQILGSPVSTNMPSGTGVAYSPNHILSAVEGGFFVYNNQQHDFQQFQDTQTVPEPSSLLMGLAGLGALALRRGRNDEKYTPKGE